MGLISAEAAATIIFTLLAAIALGFVLRFVLPAIRLNRVLGTAVQRLEKMQAGGNRPAPAQIAEAAVQVPVHQDLNGTALKNDYTIIASVRRNF